MVGLSSGPVCLAFCEPLCKSRLGILLLLLCPKLQTCSFHVVTNILHVPLMHLKNSHFLCVNNPIHLPCLQTLIFIFHMSHSVSEGFISLIKFVHFQIHFSLNFSSQNSIFISWLVFLTVCIFMGFNQFIPIPSQFIQVFFS